MASTSDIFVADPEGFRAQNADRPAAHLVRELVQNALDEDGAMNLDVTVTYHGPRRGTTVVVKDDSPEGVRDAKLLFTIWLSDKEDSPTKRGRMGRGLKEIVSVADMTIIKSCTMDALVFKRHMGGRWERKTKPRLGRPAVGTEVTAFCRGWGEKAAKDIVAFLKRVRAPGRITMRVGYRNATMDAAPVVLEQVAPFVAAERYDMTLPTVVYEHADGERKARDRQRYCTVECFVPPPGEKAYVYEMGIPVEACESPVSIDVGQRVILRERRDTLTDSYRKELFARVLSKRVEANLLTHDDLKSNAALIASGSQWDLSQTARLAIAKAWTGGLPFAANTKDFQHATGHHILAVSLKSLPEGVRDLVKFVGTDVKTVLEARKSEFCPPLPLDKQTVTQRKTVLFFEWLAKGIGRPTVVQVCSGRPGAEADFDREARLMRLYTDELGERFFKDPSGPAALGLFIHEMAHWEPREHEHGVEFHADGEDVGGKVASFLLGSAEQARMVLKETL